LCPGVTYSACTSQKYYCAISAETRCASRSATDVTTGYIRCGGKGDSTSRDTCRCN
jgi:hypothetical protein